MKKRNILVFSTVCILTLFTLIIGVNKAVKNIENNKLNAIKIEENKLISYKIYNETDIENIKILVEINSSNGIEYIKLPNDKKIICNGKKKVGIDYSVKESEDYKFIIKKINEPEQEEKIKVLKAPTLIGIDNQYPILGINGVEEGSKISIKSNEESEIKTYYKIDNDEWKEYTKELEIEGNKIYVKNVNKETGFESITISGKIEDIIGKNAYDNDLNTYYEIKTNNTYKKIQVSDEMKGKTVFFKANLMGNAQLYVENDDGTTKSLSGVYPNLGMLEKKATLSENSKYIVLYNENDSALLYEIYKSDYNLFSINMNSYCNPITTDVQEKNQKYQMYASYGLNYCLLYSTEKIDFSQINKIEIQASIYTDGGGITSTFTMGLQDNITYDLNYDKNLNTTVSTNSTIPKDYKLVIDTSQITNKKYLKISLAHSPGNAYTAFAYINEIKLLNE